MKIISGLYGLYTSIIAFISVVIGLAIGVAIGYAIGYIRNRNKQ